MDAERVRELLLKLPHVEETMQWGANLVFWVGDKSIGGKMFALVNLDEDARAAMSFHVGPERYYELVENDGVVPAPYMARIFWVALQRWDALPPRELEELLAHAHERVFARLPQRTKDVLAMAPAARKKLIAERRKLLKAREDAACAEKQAAREAAKLAAKSKPSKKPTAKVAVNTPTGAAARAGKKTAAKRSKS